MTIYVCEIYNLICDVLDKPYSKTLIGPKKKTYAFFFFFYLFLDHFGLKPLK
jgi:hypothetical protein